MKIDSNASGFIGMASQKGGCIYNSNLTMDELGECYVIWRNKVKVKDIASDESKVPDHNKEAKLKNISVCKTYLLENRFTDTTLMGMRKNNVSPIVIGDGVHRAIGIYQAYLEDSEVQNKVNLRLFLFEGDDIGLLDDYKLSVPGE